MRLHRFYIPGPIGASAEVVVPSEELAHQLKNVFRLRKGDRVVVFDGSGRDYECELIESGGKSATLRAVSAGMSRYMPIRKVWLYAALVKKDTFEVIVEKATELGVTDIVPILAERSEKKAVNEARLKKIVMESSEQSGRGDVPVVHPLIDFRVAVASVASGIQQVAFHTEGERFESGNISDSDAVAIFIGPEGGWSPDEMEMFHKEGVAVRCLGPQVLRAETAVVAALSQIVFL